MSDDAGTPDLDGALQDALQNALTPGHGDPAQNLDALKKALQDAQVAQVASEGQPAAAHVEPTIFGLTMAAIAIGLVLSAIGMGFIIYAKSERHIIFFVFGVLLLGIPFFVTNAAWLAGVGAALVVLPVLLKKYLYW